MNAASLRKHPCGALGGGGMSQPSMARTSYPRRASVRASLQTRGATSTAAERRSREMRSAWIH